MVGSVENFSHQEKKYENIFMESFAIYILTYKIKYAKLCENKFLSHFAFLLLALIFRWLSWKLKYTLYLISWVYIIKGHHCQTVFMCCYVQCRRFLPNYASLSIKKPSRCRNYFYYQLFTDYKVLRSLLLFTIIWRTDLWWPDLAGWKKQDCTAQGFYHK